MRLITKNLITGTLLSALPLAHAEGPHEFSANVALTSDYMYRGFSQSNEGPAISGGFDYGHESGFYAGIWASSIEFNPGTANASSIEIDIYSGISGDFGNGLGWDIGGLYYLYPDQDEDTAGDYDFFEVYGSLGYDITDNIGTGLFLAYSPDFYGETGDAYYIAASLDVGLAAGFGASLNIGHQDVDDTDASYTHWSIGVSKEIGALGFDVTYYDMFNASEDCGADTDICDGLVFTVSSSW
jgi:uncharacterized protein (TIGR02001 family)